MYAEHQPKIAAYAQASAHNLSRVIQFVVLTMRVPMYRVLDDMKTVDIKGARAKRELWGFKAITMGYAWTNQDQIYRDAMELAAIADPVRREHELLAYFATIPGIGLVKGGFICQLAFGCAGCLDTHNAARFNLNRNDLRGDTFKVVSAASRTKRLDIYLDIVHALGGTAKLWDTWCEYVAKNDPSHYPSADYVSELHVRALSIK